jgi:DNA-binding NarL/FixJ family response regulator
VIRVVLADDHPVVRTGYRRLLEQAGGVRVEAEAGDGDAAYAAFVDHVPDVLVTDLTMGGGGGLALIRRVLARAPEARILVFSMHDSAALVRRALDSGARGFLTKASPPDCLLLAIAALHAGERYLGPGLAPPPGNDAAALLGSLSAREFEIFRLLAQGHSVADCAQALNLSPKTVANHQTVIKEKLDVSTSAALAHLAIRHGVIASP